MKEEPQPLPQLLLFLLTSSFATLATFAVILGGALSLWLQEDLSKSQILGMALGLAGILLAAIWTGVIAASRQRSKISTLETEVRRLEVESSSLRNPPLISDLQRRSDTEDKLLLFISDKNGRTIEQIASHIGVSMVRAEMVLSTLATDLFVYRQGYTEGPSRWCLGAAGKSYLTDNDLIQ